MSNCSRCNAEIKWPVPFVKGAKPLNMDDSPHTCTAPKASKPASSTPRVEVSIDTIVAEIIAIKGTMATKKEGDNNTYVELTPQMTEGIWKYAISRKMKN